MNSNQKRPPFPTQKEIEKITKYFSDPNCKDINEGLAPNASNLDKKKYELCQSISRYKRINKLTPEVLSEKLIISEEKMNDILFGRISNLNVKDLDALYKKIGNNYEIHQDWLQNWKKPKINCRQNND